MGVDAPPAGTTEASVRAAAMGFGQLLGRLTGLGPQAEAAFDQATLAFTDLLTPPIKAQAKDHLVQLEAAVAANAYAESVLNGWADDVAWYVARVEELEAQWESVAGGSFGVAPPELSAAMPPEHQQQLLAGYDTQVAEARQEHLAALNHEAQLAYAEYLARAQQRAQQLGQGATDANVATLVAQGHLGWAAPVLWDSAPLPPLTAADGADQAGHLLTLLNDPTLGPDPTALATVDTIRWILDRAVADPASVTPGQLDFLTAFYAKLGGQVVDLDALFDRPQSSDGYVVQHVGGTPVAADAVLADDGPVLSPAAQAAAAAVLANGVMLLSNEKYGGGLGRVPTQLVAMLKDAPNRGPILPSKFPAPTVESGQSDVATSFLAHSSLPAGEGLSKELAVAAANYLDALQDPALHLTDDSTAKELLWLLGRSPLATHAAITGTDMPASFDHKAFVLDVHTYTWSDDGVAAAKLTEWIPSYKESADPAQVTMADAAMKTLVTRLTTTGPEVTAPFTLMLDAARENPKATQALGAATAAFLAEVAAANDSTDPTATEWQLMLTLLARDEPTAKAISTAINAYAEHLIAGSNTLQAATESGLYTTQLSTTLTAGVMSSALEDQLSAAQAEAQLADLMSLGTGAGTGLSSLLRSPVSTALTQVFLGVIEGPAPTSAEPVLPGAVLQVGEDENGDPIYSRPSANPSSTEYLFKAAHGFLAAGVQHGLVDPAAVPSGLTSPAGGVVSLSEIDPALYSEWLSVLEHTPGLGLVQAYKQGVQSALALVDLPDDPLEWQQQRDLDEEDS